MSAAGKRKGTMFETQVADYLQSQGVRAKRLPRHGVKDIGDVAFPIASKDGQPASVVLEAKNRNALSLAEWLAESEVEAEHYFEKHPADGPTIPVVVHKRRGKGTHLSYVTMSLDTFVDLLRQVDAV